MGYETGGGRFFKKRPPRPPTRKNFDWRGGGATGVPLTGRLKGKGSLVNLPPGNRKNVRGENFAGRKSHYPLQRPFQHVTRKQPFRETSAKGNRPGRPKRRPSRL